MKILETGWVKTLLTPEVVEKSLNILLAGLIVLLAVVLSRLMKRWLNAAMQRTRIRDDLLLRSFFLRVDLGWTANERGQESCSCPRL